MTTPDGPLPVDSVTGRAPTPVDEIVQPLPPTDRIPPASDHVVGEQGLGTSLRASTTEPQSTDVYPDMELRPWPHDPGVTVTPGHPPQMPAGNLTSEQVWPT